MGPSSPKSTEVGPWVPPALQWVFPARNNEQLGHLRTEVFSEMLREALKDVLLPLAMVDSGRMEAAALRGSASMAAGMGMLAERHKYGQRFGRSPNWLDYLPVAMAKRCLVMAQACGQKLPSSVEELCTLRER